jgi:protein O-GlcNAc transferase
MKKVISFSLWGNNPTYNIGAIKNVELAKEFYPDYECWFYIHKDTVPQETVDKLKTFVNTKIIFKIGDLRNENCKPRMWRFQAIDDPEVEIMLSRDTDTRILLREKMAVEDWLNKGTNFHIMRDHPHHNFCILAGMFGTKKIKGIFNWTNIINSYIKHDNRMYDQDFLRDFVYPLIKDNSTIHATFHKKEPYAINFPINYDATYKFVGEYVYSDESRSQEHINILKKNI